MLPLTDKIDLTGIKQRSFHDITVNNINVYYDEDMPLNGSDPDIRCAISSSEDMDDFYNINISDISVNGKKINII